jgi:hypothetical protein
MFFAEMVCLESMHATRFAFYMQAFELDRTQAAKAVNMAEGKVVCKDHAGNLRKEYGYTRLHSVCTFPKRIRLSDGSMVEVPTSITLIRLEYADGMKGYTPLFEFRIK